MKHHTVTSDPKCEEYVATAELTDNRVFIQEAAAYTKKDSQYLQCSSSIPWEQPPGT